MNNMPTPQKPSPYLYWGLIGGGLLFGYLCFFGLPNPFPARAAPPRQVAVAQPTWLPTPASTPAPLPVATVKPVAAAQVGIIPMPPHATPAPCQPCMESAERYKSAILNDANEQSRNEQELPQVLTDEHYQVRPMSADGLDNGTMVPSALYAQRERERAAGVVPSDGSLAGPQLPG